MTLSSPTENSRENVLCFRVFSGIIHHRISGFFSPCKQDPEVHYSRQQFRAGGFGRAKKNGARMTPFFSGHKVRRNESAKVLFPHHPGLYNCCNHRMELYIYAVNTECLYGLRYLDLALVDIETFFL